MRAVIVIPLLLAACGGEVPDTPPPPPVVIGDHFRYVESSIYLSSSVAEARELGLDLDGDTIVDNKFGEVFAALAHNGLGYSLHAIASTAVYRGNLIVLADLQTTSTEQADLAG